MRVFDQDETGDDGTEECGVTYTESANHRVEGVCMAYVDNE